MDCLPIAPAGLFDLVSIISARVSVVHGGLSMAVTRLDLGSGSIMPALGVNMRIPPPHEAGSNSAHPGRFYVHILTEHRPAESGCDCHLLLSCLRDIAPS
jgi:hypothetical protein